MQASESLPTEVIEALRQGRKIEAIKRLRQTRPLGLKQAKQAVDQYQREHLPQSRSASGGSSLIQIVILALLLWVAWKVFT